MKFVIRNNAKIANKYIRFAKWKIYNLSEKFEDWIYSEIHINKESVSPEYYSAVIKLGIPGPDIIVSAQSSDLNKLWSVLSSKIKRQVTETSKRRK